jgi:hypothetical protein
MSCHAMLHVLLHVMLQLYTEEARPALAAEHPGAAFAEQARLLGQGWQGLGEEGRREYAERAKVRGRGTHTGTPP